MNTKSPIRPNLVGLDNTEREDTKLQIRHHPLITLNQNLRSKSLCEVVGQTFAWIVAWSMSVRLTMVILPSTVVVVVVMVSVVVPGLVGAGPGDAADVPHQRLVLGPGRGVGA